MTTTNYRDRALELVEDGVVTAEHLLLCCLKAMSQDDVKWTLDASELSERFMAEPVEILAVRCCECDERIGETTCAVTASSPTLCPPCGAAARDEATDTPPT